MRNCKWNGRTTYAYNILQDPFKVVDSIPHCTLCTYKMFGQNQLRFRPETFRFMFAENISVVHYYIAMIFIYNVCVWLMKIYILRSRYEVPLNILVWWPCIEMGCSENERECQNTQKNFTKFQQWWCCLLVYIFVNMYILSCLATVTFSNGYCYWFTRKSRYLLPVSIPS